MPITNVYKENVRRWPNAWLDLAGVITASFYFALMFLSRQQSSVSLSTFYTIMFFVWLLCLMSFFYYKEINEPSAIKCILFWALFFRVIAFFAVPIYEDDYYRYLWDAYQFATQHNPYLAAPSAYFTADHIPPVFSVILDRINNPDITTIYGPVSQFAFLIAYYMMPASLSALKILFLLADFATILILQSMSKPRFILLYAWCPLLIFEIGFNAHCDSIGIFFMMLSIYFVQKHQISSSLISIAAAISSKVFAILLAPFILFRKQAQYYFYFLLALSLFYLPFFIMGKSLEHRGLEFFLSNFEFNSAGFALIQALLGRQWANMIAPAVFVVFYGFIFKKFRGNDIPRGDLIFGALLFLSPVINPWYVLWLLPFAVIYPSYWAWATAIMVVLSYVTGLNLQDLNLAAYNQPHWLRLIEFTPIAVVFLAEYFGFIQPLESKQC